MKYIKNGVEFKREVKLLEGQNAYILQLNFMCNEEPKVVGNIWKMDDKEYMAPWDGDLEKFKKHFFEEAEISALEYIAENTNEKI